METRDTGENEWEELRSCPGARHQAQLHVVTTLKFNIGSVSDIQQDSVTDM